MTLTLEEYRYVFGYITDHLDTAPPKITKVRFQAVIQQPEATWDRRYWAAFLKAEALGLLVITNHEPETDFRWPDLTESGYKRYAFLQHIVPNRFGSRCPGAAV